MPFLTVYGRLPKKAIEVSSPLSVRAGQAGESNDSGRRVLEKWLPKEAGYFGVRKMEIQCHFSRFMVDCRRKLSWFRRHFQYERSRRVKTMILAAGRGKSGYLKDVPRVFQHMLVCRDQCAEMHGFRKLLGVCTVYSLTRWF